MMVPHWQIFCAFLAAPVLFLFGVGLGALHEEKRWIRAAREGTVCAATSDRTVYSVTRVGCRIRKGMGL